MPVLSMRLMPRTHAPMSRLGMPAGLWVFLASIPYGSCSFSYFFDSNSVPTVADCSDDSMLTIAQAFQPPTTRAGGSVMTCIRLLSALLVSLFLSMAVHAEGTCLPPDQTTSGALGDSTLGNYNPAATAVADVTKTAQEKQGSPS
jgi:hypothetical protein